MQAPDKAMRVSPQRLPIAAKWIFLCGVIVFIVYGSLFPFNFADTPQPMSQFYENWNLFNNTSDAVDNFFLFVPMGIAISVCYTTRTARLVATTLLMLVLAVGVQLLQLYLLQPLY